MTKFIYLPSIQTSINVSRIWRIDRIDGRCVIHMMNGDAIPLDDEHDINALLEHVKLISAASKFERLIAQ